MAHTPMPNAQDQTGGMRGQRALGWCGWQLLPLPSPPALHPSVLPPGQLGEVWVWWGLAGELQEGPVLSKNADPGVVKRGA